MTIGFPKHVLACLPMIVGLSTAGCGDSTVASTTLSAESPLHLEAHLASAVIEGSEVPANLPEVIAWRFDEEQPEWHAAPIAAGEDYDRVRPVRTADALRLPLTVANRAHGRLAGQVYVDLPAWRLADWGHIEIVARAEGSLRRLGLLFNLAEEAPLRPWVPFASFGEEVPVVSDGTVQTYRLSLDAPRVGDHGGAWNELGIGFESEPDAEQVALELLAVRIVPRRTEFARQRAGVRSLRTGDLTSPYRQTIFTHAPGTLTYRLKIPEAGRLDVGLGVLGDDLPVRFSVAAGRPDLSHRTLLDEVYADGARWGQRSVDLSGLAGETVTLELTAEAETPGSVALWGSPTVSGRMHPERPNVIFYVIDGGGADFMSTYGYNRRTTPHLDRLAEQGAVFESAFSNSDWTRPSTASFMTSLQHSVLGGFRQGFNMIPAEAPTMAELLHASGYQTAVLTANPNAGRMSGLERGVDFFREDWDEFAYRGGENYRISSAILNEAFWEWREAYPAQPFWVHFQTTDLHEEIPAVAPFSGLYVGPEELARWKAWDEELGEAGGHGAYAGGFEKTGISRVEFNTLHQGIYDENLAHNDYQLGRLVQRLRAEGDWENTLLIVAADHGQGTMHETTVAVQERLPPRWNRPMIRRSISRVPLIFVWPGHIPAGLRIHQPVSMIDVLPTLLDLLGLPSPEIIQGQSLTPLLDGTEGWQSRPVVLDMYNADGFADEYSRVELIDGRWGASLEISPLPRAQPEWIRPERLLVYDLWTDPLCLRSLHEERPDLVEEYTQLLEDQWEAHQRLSRHFTPGRQAPLSSEQLEALRSLGYIQ